MTTMKQYIEEVYETKTMAEKAKKDYEYLGYDCIIEEVDGKFKLVGTTFPQMG